MGQQVIAQLVRVARGGVAVEEDGSARVHKALAKVLRLATFESGQRVVLVVRLLLALRRVRGQVPQEAALALGPEAVDALRVVTVDEVRQVALKQVVVCNGLRYKLQDSLSPRARANEGLDALMDGLGRHTLADEEVRTPGHCAGGGPDSGRLAQL